MVDSNWRANSGTFESSEMHKAFQLIQCEVISNRIRIPRSQGVVETKVVTQHT